MKRPGARFLRRREERAARFVLVDGGWDHIEGCPVCAALGAEPGQARSARDGVPSTAPATAPPDAEDSGSIDGAQAP